MSDLMRDGFEAWFSKNAPKMNAKACQRDAKAIAVKEMAFCSWAASRETLVIELPNPAGIGRLCSDMTMQEIREDNRFNRALDLAVKAIHAVGVKTK